MSTWFERWVEEEYIHLALLADQLLGKEKVADFYYGRFLPRKEGAYLLIHNLLPNLESLLKTAQKRLEDTPPFYPRSVFSQQIAALKTCLAQEISPEETDYAQAIELLLGVKLSEPDWQKHQRQLEDSLRAAGYSGSTQNMLKEWQLEGGVDVFTFMEVSRELLPGLWEEVRSKVLPRLLSDDEFDLLQESSKVNFCYTNRLWEDWPYYGSYRSVYLTMIMLNARLSWNRFEAKVLLAYEAVPGRHLLWALRQRLHDLGQFPSVSMLSMFASPERLVQEGLIACAPDFLWPQGLPDPKEQVALDYWRLRRAVGLMAAIKLCRDKDTAQQVQGFVQEQAFLPPGKAKALLGIIQERPYHYPAAQLGYELVGKFWQAYGEEFWLELPQYRCPALLEKLYPLPANKEGEQRVA